MRYAITISLVIFSITYGLGQNDFRPGYILSNKGDTTKGLVAYHEFDKQFSSCIFKSSLSTGNETDFAPDQLKGYGVKDRHYLSKQIVTNETQQTKFALILSEGKLTLFKVNEILYMQGEDNIIYGVNDFKNTEVFRNGTNYTYSDENIKRGTLQWKMEGIPKLKNRIANISLNETSLIKLFNDYNDFISPRQAKKAIKKVYPPARWLLGLSADYAYTKMNGIFYPFAYNINKKNFSKHSGASGGISLRGNVPRISEKIWINLDLLLQKRTFDSNEIEYADTSYPLITIVHIDHTSIKIPISAGYHFYKYKRRLNPLFEIGVAPSFTLQSNSYNSRQYTPAVILRGQIYSINKFTFAAFGGTGLTYDFSQKISGLVRIRYGLSSLIIEPDTGYESCLSGMLSLFFRLGNSSATSQNSIFNPTGQ